MKRLVWLFLAVFCTALAQVQPVTMPESKPVCTCCHREGSCGMVNCLPAPVSARTVSMATRSLRLTPPAVGRLSAQASATREAFYAEFVKPSASLATARRSDWVTPAASGPLFAVHCSFLI